MTSKILSLLFIVVLAIVSIPSVNALNVTIGNITINGTDTYYDANFSSVSIPTNIVPITDLFISNQDADYQKDLSSVSIPTNSVPITGLFISNQDTDYHQGLSSISIPTNSIPITNIFISNADVIFKENLVSKEGANQPPIASFTYSPKNPIADQIIIFYASNSTDPDGTIKNYEWDFGDGETGIGEVVTHAYSSVGSYEVNLTVTDDGATNSATRKITVGEVPNVIYVPDGYAKIQWAVDNASAGDTIIVRDGTYYENVVVNKHLSLKSENRSAYTTINGGGSGHVVRITADNVRMEGFTVTGSGWYEYDSGLEITSSNNIITNNSISNNNAHGIYLYSSSNNNNISSNNIYSNNYAGIYLDSSSNNSITSNNISNNYDGIVLNPSSNNSITSNNIYSNNDNGIDLYSSSNNSITSNNIYSNNWHGIALGLSYNNSISSNNIYSNNEEGIALYSSSNNSITSNNIYSNNYDGIWLYSSSNNLIFLNNLINNSYNVDFYSSTNIWNSPSKVTYTYNGSEFENYLGNYWNDYKEKYPDAEEIDGTGIGDTPYSIDGDKDNYPLKERFENYFGSVEDYSALIKCISNETDFYKKSSETTFDSWWWTERADEEMEEAMKVLASSLVGSVAGAEL